MSFKSEYVQEQKRYTKQQIRELFSFGETEAEVFINRLKAYGVLKAVKNEPQQLDLTELVDEDIAFVDEALESGGCFYVFTYVGVLTVGDRVIKCYPKYLTQPPSALEMKQILDVLRKYGSKKQLVNLYNGDGQNSSFNLLAVMLFLLQDYHENGLYTNVEDIIEVNGEGSILWDQTISNGFAIICNNRPYYTEMFTRKTIDNDTDFFYRLHKAVITEVSEQMREAGLLDIFGLLDAELTEESIANFGEPDYILYRLQSELSVQFNTHRQILLKTLYAYIANRKALAENYGLSMYGTNAYNLVWEDVCAEVFDNKLDKQLRHLQLPTPLHSAYQGNQKLIEIIAPPLWVGKKANGNDFVKPANETLIPDLISMVISEGEAEFYIFDAKYYRVTLEERKPLRGQPGVGDVTKQYLYQLAYKEFLERHNIHFVRNCFLMPTEDSELVELGYASMEMLDRMQLQHIQIRLLPAKKMYELYLTRRKYPIADLNL